MTKFEEEFKALISWDWVNVDLIQQILTRFGNWHSDEEFQELLDKYSNLNDNYEKEVIRSSKLESQIADLKSQLQQQALPVVPECVAEAIESLPGHCSAFEAISLIEQKVETLPVENEDWLPVYNWLCEGVENQDIFALAFITGKYEVEKPQLFYLKDNLTGMYLYKIMIAYNEGIKGYKWDTPTKKGLGAGNYKFTQSEIDSMQTGSYELVPVEDGE